MHDEHDVGRRFLLGVGGERNQQREQNRDSFQETHFCMIRWFAFEIGRTKTKQCAAQISIGDVILGHDSLGSGHWMGNGAGFVNKGRQLTKFLAGLQ